MDMINQMLDQMQSAVNAAQAPQSRAGQGQNDKKGEFDAMVRQKRQELGGKDAKKTGTAKPGEAREEAPAEEQVPAAEQAAMAAALLMQAQPDVRFAEIQPEVPQVTAEPVVVTEAAAVVTEELPQLSEEQPEVPVQAETAAALPGTEARPAFENAARAPEAAAAEARPETTEDAGPARVDRAPVELRQARQTRETVDAPEEEELPMEAPVFVRPETVPVKVAEPAAPIAQAPVPLEADDGVQQLAARIEDLVTDEAGNTSVQLTLTPENLGTVRVQITHSADGALRVELSATTQRAASLLERNADGLQNLLRSEERPTVQVQVRAGEEAQQQFLNPDGQQQSRQQPQQEQRQPRQSNDRAQDFLQQLRLGLVDTDEIL